MRRKLQKVALVALVAALLVALAGSVAQAGSRTISVRLSAHPSELPAYVCVVHNATKSASNDVLLARSGSLPVDVPDLAEIRAEGPWKQDDEAGEIRWRISPDKLKSLVDTRKPPLDSRIAEALSALADSAAICDLGSCAPSFDLMLAKNRKYLMCGQNPRADRRRVLMVDLTFGADGLVPLNVHVDGGVVEVLLDRELDKSSAPKLTVLGGHYAQGSQSIPTGTGDFAMELRTECQERDLDLSALHPAQGDRLFVADCGTTRSSCEARGSRVVLGLAERRPGREQELRLVSWRGEEGPETGALESFCDAKRPMPVELRGAQSIAWSEGVIPAKLPEPRTRFVSFTWFDRPPASDPKAVSCHLPLDSCPEATIDALGITACIGSRPDPRQPRCAYRCAAVNGGAGFPLEVKMSAGKQGDTWKETLSGNEEELHGYADRDSRQFEVVFEGWKPKDLEGPFDAIKTIDLRHPLWGSSTVLLAPGQRVRLPGLTCGDTLYFRMRGLRDFEEEGALVRDGRLGIPAPKTGQWWRLGLGSTSGAVLDRGFGRWRPTFSLEGQLRWEPDRSVLGLEIGLAYLLSAQSFQAIKEAQQLSQVDDARVYNRVLPSVGILGRPGHNWELYASLGPGFGWAFLQRDAAAVGPLKPFFAFRTGVRLRFSPRFAFVAGARTFLGQPFYTHELVTVAGRPTSRHDPYYTLAWELGFLVTP